MTESRTKTLLRTPGAFWFITLNGTPASGAAELIVRRKKSLHVGGGMKPLSCPHCGKDVAIPRTSFPWHLSRAGKEIGGFSSVQLKQMAATGFLQPTDLVWKDGMEEWAEASSLRNLFPESSIPAMPTTPCNVAVSVTCSLMPLSGPTYPDRGAAVLLIPTATKSKIPGGYVHPLYSDNYDIEELKERLRSKGYFLQHAGTDGVAFFGGVPSGMYTLLIISRAGNMHTSPEAQRRHAEVYAPYVASDRGYIDTSGEPMDYKGLIPLARYACHAVPLAVTPGHQTEYRHSFSVGSFPR